MGLLRWVADRFHPALPPRVALFYWRAMRHATAVGDAAATEGRTTPRALAQLLRLARGRREVAEIGTGPGWTALALALADPDRHVVTVDPLRYPNRDAYAALVPPEVRSRVEFVEGRGGDGSPHDRPVDFLFIDDEHAPETVVAAFRAWEPALSQRAIVAFHDYDAGWPGVIEAVDRLGLRGTVRAATFVWHR